MTNRQRTYALSTLAFLSAVMLAARLGYSHSCVEGSGDTSFRPYCEAYDNCLRGAAGAEDLRIDKYVDRWGTCIEARELIAARKCADVEEKICLPWPLDEYGCTYPRNDCVKGYLHGHYQLTGGGSVGISISGSGLGVSSALAWETTKGSRMQCDDQYENDQAQSLEASITDQRACDAQANTAEEQWGNN